MIRDGGRKFVIVILGKFEKNSKILSSKDNYYSRNAEIVQRQSR